MGYDYGTLLPQNTRQDTNLAPFRTIYIYYQSNVQCIWNVFWVWGGKDKEGEKGEKGESKNILLHLPSSHAKGKEKKMKDLLQLIQGKDD